MGGKHGRFVAYYRVSTARQGRSGLGLEAQKRAVREYLGSNGWELIGEHVEVESGKRHENRPELQAALTACRKNGATLVIAKLDRLSRNLAFLAALIESGVALRAVDMPDANKTMIQMFAVLAEWERDQISARTKSALAAARSRGVRLGNPDPERSLSEGRKTIAQNADGYLENLLPVVSDIRGGGVTSLRGIARELARRNVETRRGKTTWTAGMVKQYLDRAARRGLAA